MAAKTNPAVSLVHHWHTALNNEDTDRLVALVDPQVQIVGPRGTAAGVPILKEWVERAKVKLLPQQYFAQNDVVIAEEIGEWYAPDTGSRIGSQTVFTCFLVKEGCITSIARYDHLNDALTASGLSHLPEVYPSENT